MMKTGPDGAVGWGKIGRFYSKDFHGNFMADGTRTWICMTCGFVYDEAEGLPEEGIVPGTRWEDLPPNWACPECGARKEDFEMFEVKP